MSFIGNVPAEAYSPVTKDTFSGNGSTTDFTLSIPATTNSVEVFVENVQQEPTDAYTISGTTLSFTAAPVSGTDNIYVIHRGPAVQTVVPPGDSITTAMIQDGAVTAAKLDSGAIFASGTVMLFVQTSAPTGWTKSTTHNNKALRIVSGTAGTGGTVDFTTAFSDQNVDATTLTTDQIPSHNHSYFVTNYTASQANTDAVQGRQLAYQTAKTTGSTGGGNSHTHGIDLAVSYVDVIIATKD